MKLAIITTHPIQYYAPVFKLLHERKQVSVNVFYTQGKNENTKYDPGFNKVINWDIPLLDYPHTWAKNISSNPGSNHFFGIVNPGLISEIKAWQPDAILIYGWAYASHIIILKHFKNKIPVYFRGDSTILNKDTGIKKRIKDILLKWVYKQVDHAFYVGTRNKHYFLNYGLHKNQLSFAPHAIDNKRFSIDKYTDVTDLRNSLNIKDNDILILYAGKFEPVKNVKILLTAFINLNKENVHLLLTGNGIDESTLKTQAQTSHTRERIHFIDFKNQSYMPVIYQASDIFCLPSVSESWGLSVNEAMACSKAVLVSDKVGCAIDLVKNNYNGFVFKSEDIDDLATCLDKLTRSKSDILTFGINSRSIIEDWNFTNIATAIENKLLHLK